MSSLSRHIPIMPLIFISVSRCFMFCFFPLCSYFTPELTPIWQIHKRPHPFVIFIPTKQYLLFFPVETWSLVHNWNLYSAHLPTLLCLATFPGNWASAKPKKQQQQKSLKVKAPDLKVGHRPDTGGGEIFFLFFWEGQVLKLCQKKERKQFSWNNLIIIFIIMFSENLFVMSLQLHLPVEYSSLVSNFPFLPYF